MQASRVSASFVWHKAHCGTESEHQVLNGSHIFISLHEYWYYLVLRSNIHVKGDKMKRENNPVRLTFNSWCSLSVPQCAAAYRENWNSWCLYTAHMRPFLWLTPYHGTHQSESCLQSTDSEQTLKEISSVIFWWWNHGCFLVSHGFQDRFQCCFTVLLNTNSIVIV